MLSFGACCQAELPKAVVPWFVIGSGPRQESGWAPGRGLRSSLAPFVLHQSCTLLSEGAKGEASSDCFGNRDAKLYQTDAGAASVSLD